MPIIAVRERIETDRIMAKAVQFVRVKPPAFFFSTRALTTVLDNRYANVWISPDLIMDNDKTLPTMQLTTYPHFDHT